jgi:RNA polymerase sigma-70 factor (ECF subfamily)
LDPERLGDHVDRLYRAAWALCGSREDAEGLVQETFERMLRKPRFIRKDDDLGYLLLTMRNTYATRRRTASRRPPETAIPQGQELVDASGSMRPDEAADNATVIAAISNLPDGHVKSSWRSTSSGSPTKRLRRLFGRERARS